MPRKNYSQVPNTEYDLRIPLHSEESFQHGIIFQAKYIGSLDVPRPNNRMEIVAAMRRIRYEFKSKGQKKRKVNFQISVEGVQVSLVKRKVKKKDWPLDDSSLLLMQHPVYRIFYVSHDSQDLKIFSYIARDASSNFFRCNVFKTNKKSQAMKIVRTVGQAFEVCHKFATINSAALTSSTSPTSLGSRQHELMDGTEDEGDEHTDEDRSQQTDGDLHHLDGRSTALSLSIIDTKPAVRSVSGDYESDLATNQKDEILSLNLMDCLATPRTTSGDAERQQPPLQPQPNRVVQDTAPAHNHHHQQQQRQESQQQQQQLGPSPTPTTSTPLALQHEVLLLRQQVDQQQQQTQAAIAQVKLLKDQLAAETAARMEAQARTHQLLIHNKELLDHIQSLVMQMQELEYKVPAHSAIPQINAGMNVNNQRLPTLREVDAQQEMMVNMAAAMLSAVTGHSNNRELQTQHVLQHQLQQQQQQYAFLLAQAVQQQQQQQQSTGSLLPLLSPSPLSPLALNSQQQSGGAFFPFQGLATAQLAVNHNSPTPTPTQTPTPTHFHSSPNSSFNSLLLSPGGVSPKKPAHQQQQQQQVQSASSTLLPASSPFILPLAECGADQSGSHDSGLGSGHMLGIGAVSSATAASVSSSARHQRSNELIRRLQLIGEDSSGGGASVTSLLSSDSDRQRMDSSLESMASGGGGGGGQSRTLPSLHQQLEHLRLESDGDEYRSSPPSSSGGGGGALRRNGPFITRSTSEKVPHRNEILAQVQRTAWARHTTK